MEPRTRRELTALRLTAQRIAMPPAGSVADTVRWMLAMQAQDLPAARWAVGLRTPGATDGAVATALAEGSVVRSWPMRGTLHLIAPEDLGWMLELTRPRVATSAATRRAALGVTPEHLAGAADIVHATLAGGGTMRRDRLLESVELAGIPTSHQRGYHILWALAQDGHIVFGAPDGAQPTFSLFHERVTEHRRLEGDEALGELAARYVRSHGPATERDLAWWSSLTLSQARRGLDIARMPSIEREGVRYHVAPELEPARGAVHLLPGFDEFLLGYQDRSAPLAEEHAPRIVPGNNGVFQPTIVTNGIVTGTWRRAAGAKRVVIDLEPFDDVSAAARGRIDRAAARYARFLGTPALTR